MVFVSPLYVLNLLPKASKFNHFQFEKSAFHARRGDHPLVGIFFAFGTREHYGTLIAYISLINTIFYML
nr:MAG TPA: hypothetical protein [Caudoviricetes sp.]